MKSIKRIYLISTIFNLIMIVVKRGKTIKVIHQKCDKLGYDVNDKLLRNIFKQYIIDHETQEIYIIFEYLRELFCFVPIINIVDNIRNIEYLNGNYIHNLRFYNYERLFMEYSKENMIITKRDSKIKKLTYNRSGNNEKE